VEALQLAQQATLETRDAKHEPRSLIEQRAAWHAEAAETLGGSDAPKTMITNALNPSLAPSIAVDGEWLAATAEKVLAAVEEHRSTWQCWHVRAEAQRHIRAVQVPTVKVDQLVELLVTEVLRGRSVALTEIEDGISEPSTLRRADGSSVYTVAGSELFTSARILAAEQRLVATASRTDGRVAEAETVALALLEAAANGNALDAGQAALVRAMCTSGVRLQLAIAPAGAGKTTAMRTLARAWRDSGGQVLGLAPSAAAAAQLRDATGAPAETLAKLTWSIDHGDLPGWAERIGRSTLVIIDEAGMADTLSLDTAVQFIVGRGGSVRLVGDDQQLAAIGAAAYSEISKPAMARSDYMSCTASPTLPRPLRPSLSATADPTRSGSTWTGSESTLETPRPPSTMFSTLGSLEVVSRAATRSPGQPSRPRCGRRDCYRCTFGSRRGAAPSRHHEPSVAPSILRQ
jgi:AAA domain